MSKITIFPLDATPYKYDITDKIVFFGCHNIRIRNIDGTEWLCFNYVKPSMKERHLKCKAKFKFSSVRGYTEEETESEIRTETKTKTT